MSHSQFWNDASFRDAKFEKNTCFAQMRVEGASPLQGRKFGARPIFSKARFAGETEFPDAISAARRSSVIAQFSLAA